jgi:large subunit ribosomal protein L32
MGLPGHRRTSSHKRRRAAHFALESQTLGTCPKCSSPILPHRACQNCGAYHGRPVLDMSREAKRLLKRAESKKAASEPPAEPKEAKENTKEQASKE